MFSIGSDWGESGCEIESLNGAISFLILSAAHEGVKISSLILSAVHEGVQYMKESSAWRSAVHEGVKIDSET